MEKGKFQKLFAVEKPIIGMIHLAGDSAEEKVDRALVELAIYQEEGVNGAIIEDYHATGKELVHALQYISKLKWNIKLGINYLREPCSAFELAKKFGLDFIQLDSVLGTRDKYLEQKIKFPDLVVLGGVRFKYQQPTGRTLEQDVAEGKSRCDAIVTTGEGTGIETPIEKLIQFKELIGNFPLIVGAGVNIFNVYEQLKIADAAIIGSYFKYDSDTQRLVDGNRVRDLMSVVRDLRK